jgi:hypothetical protein
LDGEQELVSALYGILMLLPQSEAFRLIQNRFYTDRKIKFS